MIDLNIIYIVIMIIFLVLSAFFSSAEAAFLSIKSVRLRHLENTGVKGARSVRQMVEKPEKLLPTILLGNNLVNVGFASIATALFVDLVGQGKGVAMATAVGTIILLIFGENIPKTLAIRHAEKVTFLYATILRWIGIGFFPIVVFIQFLNQCFSKLFGGSPTALITEEEIQVLISMGQRVGAVDKDEAEMLQKVFRFGDMQLREIMTPRIEIVWVENNISLKKFLKIYTEHFHTRFPVFQGDVDNVIGVLSIKDVMKGLTQTGMSENMKATQTIRDPLFVPETKLIASLFDEMRRSGNQMAMGIDEYGGISGLVTLKQLIEEVVGKVGEEGEEAEEEYETIGENAFQVDGAMGVVDANIELGLSIPEGEYDTVAGFVLESLGKIPKTGDYYHFDNTKFEVTEMDNHKIEKVTVVRATPMREEEDGNDD